MSVDMVKAGNRPRSSAPARWIPSRMTTSLARRWPAGGSPVTNGSGSGHTSPRPSLIGRQLTGYGGSELVIESNVKATGYISEKASRKDVNRQLTGFDSPMEEMIIEETSSTRPKANGLKRAKNDDSSPPMEMPKPVSAPPPKMNGVTPHSPMSTSSTPKVNGTSAPAAPTANTSHQEVVKKEEEPPSHSSSYKFVYLNLRARGEVSRLLFAAAGQDYENVLFDAPLDFNLADFWSAREQSPESFPYGQLPILEVDGEIIAQSHAIERFLADRFGFFGKPGSVERAQIDAVVEHCTDVFNKFISHVFSPDKDELIVQHYNEYFPQKCDYLEAVLKRNGTGWMVGDSMTLADISVYQNVLMTGVPDYVRQSLEGFNPLLLALGEKVESNPGIARWLQERPDTFL